MEPYVYARALQSTPEVQRSPEVGGLVPVATLMELRAATVRKALQEALV